MNILEWTPLLGFSYKLLKLQGLFSVCQLPGPLQDTTVLLIPRNQNSSITI